MKICVKDNGYLEAGTLRFPCVLGRTGVGKKQKEGDGLTPVGTYPLREVYYRSDKLAPPKTSLPLRAISQNDGWCDDPAHVLYNQKVDLPFKASHEKLWRDDDLYDLIVVIGYNDDPIVPGRGSAIFIHVAREDRSPTEGCVALRREDLLSLLEICDKKTEVLIVAPV